MLALARLQEPAIRFNITADVNHLICRSKKSKKPVFADEALDSFLNSAMNIEFVYILLIGIKHYFDSDYASDKKVDIETDNSTTNVTFNKFAFANPEKWDVTRDTGLSTAKTSLIEDSTAKI